MYIGTVFPPKFIEVNIGLYQDLFLFMTFFLSYMGLLFNLMLMNKKRLITKYPLDIVKDHSNDALNHQADTLK
jgi:hypothetical protein